MEIKAINGSNIVFTYAVRSLSTSASSVAVPTALASMSSSVNVNSHGRAGFFAKPPIETSSIGTWSAIGKGQCDIFANLDAHGPANISNPHQVEEVVKVT